MRYRVMCTVKNPDHSRILSVGCVDTAGSHHNFDEPRAIKLIEDRLATFYVERPDGHSVEVIVEETPAGHKFLKTEADGEKPNNLLSLPHCKSRSVVVPPPPSRVVTPARSHGTLL